MSFNDIVGQEEIKALLIKEVQEDRLPHALLFSGPSGSGKLAMAVALANYLLCQHPSAGDVCGNCPACKQIAKFAHPDLHFSFPVIKKGTITTCDDYYQEWMEMLKTSLYFGFEDWLQAMSTDTKQAYIFEAESDRIIDRLSISSYEGGKKVMIIWLPEKMNTAAANNLLKTLEEPTPDSVFILVSNDTSTILPTIISRTQNISFHPLPQETIAEALMQRNGLEKNMALQLARISSGSYLKALQLITVGSDGGAYFECFTSLMRSAYARDLVGLKSWSEGINKWGREKQKNFLAYCQNMIRENFMYNFHLPQLNFMDDKESQFAVKFSRFINERNVIGFVTEFTKAQRDIEQNVNGGTVLFDLALKCIILIRK